MFLVSRRLFDSGKATSTSLFVLLLISTLAFALNIRLVNANDRIVPDGYPSIQAAINAAASGDTVLVRAGTYYEQVVLNKTVFLIGENMQTTIINGYNAEDKGSVITIEANGVVVENFSIMNSGNYGGNAGISVGGCNGTVVRNTKITDCMWGIYVWSSWFENRSSFNTTLIGNEVYGSNIWGGGIRLSYCFNCTLRNNHMEGNADDFTVNGDEVSHFVHDIDSSNIVEGSRHTYYLINQHDITINPPAYPNAGFLALVNSTNIKVESMELGNCEPGLLFAFTNNSLITGNNVSSCRSAIDLIHSSNNSIVGNHLGPDNHDSIVIEKTSNNNTIDGNTILKNQGDGIQISGSIGNVITRNNISNTTEGDGIVIYNSLGETLIGNNISGARYGNGILLDRSSGCKLRSNRMYLNQYDFGVTGDDASHFDHDIDQSNLVEDKIMYYLSDQHNVILDPSTLPQVGFLGLVQSTNVTVQNMDIYGLILAFTENSVITGNTISYCQEGMLLFHSSKNTIAGNTASFNEKNIHLSFSSGNMISDNTFTDSNVHEAILLDTLSDNNNLTGNVLTNNSNGIKLSNSSNNIIIGNTIRNTSWYGFGNGIETWDESNNNTISRNTISDNAATGIRIISSSNAVTENVLIGNGWGGGLGGIYSGDGISLDGAYAYETGCQNNTVSGNTIANTYGEGISLWAPSNNTITRNIITNSSGQDGGIWGIIVNDTEITGNSITNNKNNGISLYYCFHNNVSENYIANNGNYGISLDIESSNFIYHNNFINNTLHVLSTGDSNNTWDDGYPSGGNYWSGYNDTDLWSGPDQNQPGNDSIWDHPYTISSLEADRYPLVNPWPNSRCTIHFYTNPASPDSSIDFEGQTYGNGDTRTCIYGTSNLVTANPPEGYIFDHWEAEGNVRVSNDRDNPTYTAINCGGNLTAVFSQIPQPVQITIQANGIGSDASETVFTIDGNNYTYSQLPQTYTWDVGSKHTVVASNSLSAGSDKRYLWTGWTNGDGLTSRSGTYSVPSSSQTVAANYNTQYYVTVQTNPSEGGYVSPASGWRNAGSTVEIDATAYGGFVFDSWSGSGPGSYTGPNNTASVAIDGPITEIANFEAVEISEFSGTQYLALSVLTAVGTAVILSAQTKRQPLRKKG